MPNQHSYLTEIAYQRWYRQYQFLFNNYIAQLNNLRIRADSLAPTDMKENILTKIDEIDEKLDDATPRNFGMEGKPLSRGERFLENCKVLMCLVLKLFQRKPNCKGIYRKEMERVLKIHQDFKFKEKLQEVVDLFIQLENETRERLQENFAQRVAQG